jgi:hexosaminidase
VGAWRNGSQTGAYSKQEYDTVRYGGFYTQAEIKEVVKYASERNITIVPEIEMPGHSLAALAAYPQLSCAGGPFNVAKGWGVFDDVYCTKEETFRFLEDVLDEVCALFPGKYIHIGGDECPKTRWKTCANCQSRMKQENLKDERELQSYFITRMEKYLNKKGKQVIGWDEILEGGLAPNAAVMSWRGIEGGVAAAKEKHQVVMTPGKPCYFDHYQSQNTKNEPLAIGGYNPLDSVYAYDPTPKSLSAEEKKYILGAQGNVWTEYMTSFKQVEYMALPRMAALSEVLWTMPENKNYAEFIMRLKQNTFILDKMGANYAKHFLAP